MFWSSSEAVPYGRFSSDLLPIFELRFGVGWRMGSYFW